MTSSSSVAWLGNYRTYNLVLTAWANEVGPTEAEKVLDRLDSHEGLQPNSISYITCMDSYARNGDVDNTLRLLSRMEKAFTNGNLDAKPTRRAYTSALNALAKSQRGDSGQRAEILVANLERQYKAGNEDLKPDTTIYNILIRCHKSSVTRQEKILYKMGKRDVVSYSTVIQSYSQLGGKQAAHKAQQLLDEACKDGLKPNAQLFNSAITAWSRSGAKESPKRAEQLLRRMEDNNIQPNAIVYTSVINAWAKSGEAGSALRCEVLLKLMRVMYKQGSSEMKPNAQTFTTVISAWARSGERDACDHVERLVDTMLKLSEGDKDMAPNVYTMSAAVDAYARAGGRGAASKANDLVKRLEAIGVKANLQTYNALISVYGNSQQMGSPQMAESILTKLEESKDIMPTVVSYTSVVNAWAKSSEKDKARRSQLILERMKSLHVKGMIGDKPNTFTFTAVINACATTYGADQEERSEAFRIAYNTFKELTECDYASPNHVTYSTFFRAIGKLVPHSEKRDSIVSASFRLCCRDGLVDENSFFHLKNAASPELFADLMATDSIVYDDLPMDWKCNVKATPRSRSRVNE
jgi:pentatricopeptide repeat protein